MVHRVQFLLRRTPWRRPCCPSMALLAAAFGDQSLERHCGPQDALPHSRPTKYSYRWGKWPVLGQRLVECNASFIVWYHFTFSICFISLYIVLHNGGGTVQRYLSYPEKNTQTQSPGAAFRIRRTVRIIHKGLPEISSFACRSLFGSSSSSVRRLSSVSNFCWGFAGAIDTVVTVVTVWWAQGRFASRLSGILSCWEGLN